MNNRSLVMALSAVLALVVVAFAALMILPAKKPAPPNASAVEMTLSRSAEEKQAREEIRKVQAQFKESVRKKDLDGVLRLLTVDFIQQPLNGPALNRAQAEAAMKQSWPHVRSIEKWDLQLLDLKLEKDRAVGLVKESLVASLADADGGVHRQETNTQSRNTWVRTPSGWKYQRMVELVPGEGTLGETDYVSRDEWAKGFQKARQANRRESEALRDQAAAVKGEKPLSPAEARTMLEKTYSDFRASVRRKDVDAALSNLTDDYVVEFPTYNQPRLAMEAAVKKEFKNTVAIPAWTQSISNIQVDGNVVSAIINEQKTSVIKDAKGVERRATMNTRMRDTWVKTRGGWKNRRTEVLGVTITADGKTRKVF